MLFNSSATGLADTVAYGLRTPEVRFPIEVWPSSDDCPVPTINNHTYAELQSHNIDTVFYDAANFQNKVRPGVNSRIVLSCGVLFWSCTGFIFFAFCLLHQVQRGLGYHSQCSGTVASRVLLVGGSQRPFPAAGTANSCTNFCRSQSGTEGNTMRRPMPLDFFTLNLNH